MKDNADVLGVGYQIWPVASDTEGWLPSPEATTTTSTSPSR